LSTQPKNISHRGGATIPPSAFRPLSSSSPELIAFFRERKRKNIPGSLKIFIFVPFADGVESISEPPSPKMSSLSFFNAEKIEIKKLELQQ
jgi:hypothetical protein